MNSVLSCLCLKDYYLRKIRSFSLGKASSSQKMFHSQSLRPIMAKPKPRELYVKGCLVPGTPSVFFKLCEKNQLVSIWQFFMPFSSCISTIICRPQFVFFFSALHFLQIPSQAFIHGRRNFPSLVAFFPWRIILRSLRRSILTVTFFHFSCCSW